MSDMSEKSPREQIQRAVSLRTPQSFFLYAGAGSGKTATLVTALLDARDSCGQAMRARGSRFGVITFTNAAAREISARLGEDPLIDVSTIHSFAWNLIRPHTANITLLLEVSLSRKIEELERKEAAGRPGAASEKRRYDLDRHRRRLGRISEVRQYDYSSAQIKPGRDGLSHEEVLTFASDLLETQPVMQQLLIGRYPFLFIDEVQDTREPVIEALLAVEKLHKGRFALGLFGDTMQRIYPGGKADLEDAVDARWPRPKLTVNYRSGRRIVGLVNSIRTLGDGREQTANASDPGVVRLFVATEGRGSTRDFEENVRAAMRSATGDHLWTDEREVKTLILEHAMAAVRHGFANFYRAFAEAPSLRGEVFTRSAHSSGPVNFLGTQLLPLVSAVRNSTHDRLEALLRTHSPLLDPSAIGTTGEDRSAVVANLRAAIADLREHADAERVNALELLRTAARQRLLEAPEGALAFLASEALGASNQGGEVEEVDADLEAWRDALSVDIDEIERFYEYVSGEAPFDTHQGVKGLEFHRVMAVLDDASAAGHLFSYGKVLGITDLSHTDKRNQSEGKETTLDRTLRLLYVVCSRAQESLALVLYTSDPEVARNAILALGWFDETEIILDTDLVGCS